MSFYGFVLAGTHSGAGKTTITTGILSALSKRGYEVQPYKTGPDYIDPAFHSFVVGRKSRNLDTWLLDEDSVRYLFAKNCQEAEVVVVEGVMGLFDGFGGKEDIGSTASLAKTLNLPVVLIVDGSGMARSAAAIVHGYATFDPQCRIAGVIVNKVSGKKHYDILKEAIEHGTGIPCLGYVASNNQIELSSRHLGLVPAHEVANLKEQLETVAQMVEETIDLDLLLKIAEGKKPDLIHHKILSKFGNYEGLRVGIALDESFNFYYWDNIDLMKDLGCECVFFSPMHDATLPENLDFIYIGGGFPEVFAAKLRANETMKASLRDYHQKSKPIYAECGGLMYLTEAITDFNGNRETMTGILPGETRMTGKLKHFGYNEIVTSPVLTGSELLIRAHEFHRSEYIHHDLTPQYTLSKNRGTDHEVLWHCGYINNRAFGAYAHVHFYSEPEWLYFWLDQAKLAKENSNESI